MEGVEAKDAWLLAVHAAFRPRLGVMMGVLAYYLWILGNYPILEIGPWVTALTMSLVVGTILALNLFPPGMAFSKFLHSFKFGIMRAFLTPFLVSSYTAAINRAPRDEFTLLFPADLRVLGYGLVCGVTAFVLSRAIQAWVGACIQTRIAERTRRVERIVDGPYHSAHDLLDEMTSSSHMNERTVREGGAGFDQLGGLDLCRMP